jgi:hypothetical protein
MSIREKYIDFMLENVIGSNISVQLPRPEEDGKLFWVKLGPTVYINVDLEVIEKYTRSVKFKLKFDKYELEQIIFIPIESSPISIEEKLINKIEKLVCKTFLEDNRQDDMRQMYEDKRKKLFSGIENLVGKMKEIDEYSDAYKNYLNNSKKYTGCCPDCGEGYENEEDWEEDDECICGAEKVSKLLSKEEFTNKIKTDDEFAKKWGNTPNKIVE